MMVHASQVQRLKQEKGFWWASDYWSANVYQQASNGQNFPYGQKGGSRWQQIALSEGWGYFMEWRMSTDLLPNYSKDIDTDFPYEYGKMFRSLDSIGCNYYNMERSLGVYSLNEFKNNFVRYYPNKLIDISTIINNYE